MTPRGSMTSMTLTPRGSMVSIPQPDLPSQRSVATRAPRLLNLSSVQPDLNRPVTPRRGTTPTTPRTPLSQGGQNSCVAMSPGGTCQYFSLNAAALGTGPTAASSWDSDKDSDSEDTEDSDSESEVSSSPSGLPVHRLGLLADRLDEVSAKLGLQQTSTVESCNSVLAYFGQSVSDASPAVFSKQVQTVMSTIFQFSSKLKTAFGEVIKHRQACLRRGMPDPFALSAERKVQTGVKQMGSILSLFAFQAPPLPVSANEPERRDGRVWTWQEKLQIKKVARDTVDRLVGRSAEVICARLLVERTVMRALADDEHLQLDFGDTPPTSLLPRRIMYVQPAFQAVRESASKSWSSPSIARPLQAHSKTWSSPSISRPLRLAYTEADNDSSLPQVAKLAVNAIFARSAERVCVQRLVQRVIARASSRSCQPKQLQQQRVHVNARASESSIPKVPVNVIRRWSEAAHPSTHANAIRPRRPEPLPRSVMQKWQEQAGKCRGTAPTLQNASPSGSCSPVIGRILQTTPRADSASSMTPRAEPPQPETPRLSTAEQMRAKLAARKLKVETPRKLIDHSSAP